jgi:hypothetical protein
MVCARSESDNGDAAANDAMHRLCRDRVLGQGAEACLEHGAERENLPNLRWSRLGSEEQQVSPDKMPSERITVEMGGYRKRCTMVGRPMWDENEGGLVSSVRYEGKEIEIVDVYGVWLTRPAWEHVKRVLDRSTRKRK